MSIYKGITQEQMWLAIFFNSEENIETTTIKHRDENEETKKWCGWKRKKSILYTHESSSWEFRQMLSSSSTSTPSLVRVSDVLT